LSLSIIASKELCPTLPWDFECTLRRQAGPKEPDKYKKDIFVQWSAAEQSNNFAFVILHKSPQGLKLVQPQIAESKDLTKDSSVRGLESSILPYNGEISTSNSLPIEYWPLLEVDESYLLSWPGGEISSWAW